MIDTELLKVIVPTAIGSVLGSGAVFGFVQFLIQRNDKKKENTIEKKLDEVKDEFRKGLDDREETGKRRYEEHKEAIKGINEKSEERYDELKSALIKLAENAKERDKYEHYVGAALMAISHDKIIYLGKKYQRRGAITLAEKSNLKYFFTPYSEGLDGNGDAKEIYLYCMTLPIVSDIDAQKMDFKLKSEELKEMMPSSS